MTVQEMREIIAGEELEKYSRFYFGTTYIGENCISMKPMPEGQYEVCVTGERGKNTAWILSEPEACEKVIDYLRFRKRTWMKYGPPF